jgi:lipopolysaccharide transport system permease protein
MDPSVESKPYVTIQANAPAFWNLAELWTDREILLGMVWRDIAVRYKETVIGFLWVVLQPVLMMLILSVFFQQMGGTSVSGVPVHVRIFASLLIWDFISMGAERAAVSLVMNAGVISKLYFCRLILPLTPIGASAFDLCIKFVLLMLLMAITGTMPSVLAVFVPVVLLCALMFTMSVCIWLAALTAFYKDVALAIPFLLRILFFLSPIFYEAKQLVPVQYQTLYHLNPITALVESFNFLLLGTDVFPAAGLAFSMVLSLVMLVTGLSFFRYVETSIVDVL